MTVNHQRLATFFTELCEIESPSRHEAKVSRYLQENFSQLGADTITVDDSSKATGSDTGNLTVAFSGDEGSLEPVFFICHMDTVGPTQGLKVVRTGDIFTSGGDTILGADDKSGIAALLELLSLLKENKVNHCPIELVFTTCEEIGLLGAKAYDTSTLKAAYGYALDSTLRDKIITGAPTANRLRITIKGKAAHSGSSPESGINALAIAADAITRIRLGRIDNVSTANFGLIHGGTATNIVPDTVTLEGEVRSHSASLLNEYTAHIADVFEKVAENWPDGINGARPKVITDIYEDFPLMSLQDDEPVLNRIRWATKKLGQLPSFDIAGGGSDANIFCGHGLRTAILPTGMAKVHTTEEQVDLKDMIKLTQLLAAIVSPE